MMRPQGMNPRIGVQGPHRPNLSNQNNTIPQFTRPPPPFIKGPRQSRGNGNPNTHGGPPAPYGPTIGPNGQMMRPNLPMMGPNGPKGPVMMPGGPMMGPNGPMMPPGFMDPSSFNNMMMRPPPPPGSPMPMGPPPIFANGSFARKTNGKGPYQPVMKSEKEGVSGKREKKSEYEGTGQGDPSYSEENWNYNYSQFGTVQGMNCGWQGNFPGAWNFSNPTNQFYYQNSDQNQDPQYSNQSNNQDYSQTFYQNYDDGYNQNYDNSYYQYYNHGQPFMQTNYYNVKQEHSNVNPNYNQNGVSKNAPKIKKRREMSQKMRTHYCDTCDKSFPTDEALATHLSEHKVCGLDDCKFTAHPKVVDKHQQMQHFTGLYRRIGSLYTPEDIEKWRKDRKKNYPTPKNVEERRAKQQEMYARGERIRGPNNRFSRNQQQNQQNNGRFPPRQHPRADHQKNDNPPGPRHPPPNISAAPPKRWKPVFPAVTAEIEESEVRSGVKPFSGTVALLPKTENFSIKTDASKPTEKIIASSSLSFLSIYGNSSSEEDSDSEESENSTSRNVEESTEKNSPSDSMTVDKDTSVPENTEVFVSSKLETKSSSELLPVDVLQPPPPLEAHTVCTNDGLEEKKETGSSSVDTTNGIVVSHLQCEAETSTSKTDTRIQATDEESDDFRKNFRPSSNISRTPPGSSAKEPKSPVPDPKIPPSSDLREKSILIGGLNQVTDEVSNDTFGSDKPSDVMVPNKPTCAAEEPSDVNDCSDDSGPEEVPIMRHSGAIGDKEDDNEEVEEVVNSVGGRKRRRQPRNSLKKLKTDDEKQTNENQPHSKNQGQFDNKRVQRPHRPPIRRAPTLLEKLLSKEICHERNVILQCVRYVVENNYFRRDRSKASEGDAL